MLPLCTKAVQELSGEYAIIIFEQGNIAKPLIILSEYTASTFAVKLINSLEQIEQDKKQQANNLSSKENSNGDTQ